MNMKNNPWAWFVGFLLFELWLLLQIPETVLTDSPIARQFVAMMARILPVIHQLDRIARKPEVLHLFLALAPILLIPKVIFWAQWLNSDKLRNLRYFVVSPLTSSVPKRATDFVTDPLRSDKENLAASATEPISMRRRIWVSIAILIFAVVFGIFLPWVIYGFDVQRGQPADTHVMATANGGWQLWLSWSVYQMNFAAICLAIGYYVARDYLIWAKSLIQDRGELK